MDMACFSRNTLNLAGGLELDDEFMALYVADAEQRMRQEVALLQDRLQDINRRAASKMDQMESELTTERVPQKRQALIRAQRLLQVGPRVALTLSGPRLDPYFAMKLLR